MTGWGANGMLAFHPYRWYQLKVIHLDSRVRIANDFHRRIVAERQSNAGSLDVTLLQIHSRGGGTILTSRCCSASSKLIVTRNNNRTIN